VTYGDTAGGRRRRHRHRPLTAGDRCATTVVDAVAAVRADGRQEDAPERGAEQTVDDEVTRRVDDDQDVAQLRVVEMKATALSVGVVEQSPEDLVEESRSLTHDEDADDCDDALSDVVILTTFPATQLRHCGRRRRRRLASDGVQCTDELDVEVGKAGQRHQVHDRVVEDVAVDDLVDLIASESKRFRANLQFAVVAGGIHDILRLPNHLQHTITIKIKVTQK